MPYFESLYIHFPFCETKCHYCDFYSLGRSRTQEGDPKQFERALQTELEILKPSLAPKLKTVFMGGGTPSMTPPEEMEKILSTSNFLAHISPETEWTIEANPSSLNFENIKKYKTLGVNRVSLGVQSLNETHLKLLGRVHNANQALQALEDLFNAGIKNASTDLLCGVPEQTLEDLESHLTTLTRFPITHLSCYLLTLAKHHPMYKDLPNEETQLSHLLFIDQWMTSKGFEHYEISNFSKPGLRSQHNLNYWKGGSYLGLGPSAHSYDKVLKKRWKNFSSLHRYADSLKNKTLPIECEETLSPEQIKLEQWMLALRLNEGAPRAWIQAEKQIAWLNKFESENLIEPHPENKNNFRLTPRGFALSDQIVKYFV